MAKLTWKESAELVGIAAIIGSLVFVGLQLKQAQAQPVDPTNWTAIERGIIEEQNHVRQKPQSYIPHLEARLASMDARGNIPNGCGPNCTMQTKEGKAAVAEAIDFLRNQQSLGALSFSSGVARASKAHATEQSGGATGHVGADGSSHDDRFRRHGVTPSGSGENITYGRGTAQSMVLRLIIDDGTRGRGHRKNIFSHKWTATGVGCGPHTTYNGVCVIGYIASSQDNSSAGSASTAAAGNPVETNGSQPAVTQGSLKVVHSGTVDLLALEIAGADLLGGTLSPGHSRDIQLEAGLCQADLTIRMGGGYLPTDWPELSLCGATLTIDDQNGFGLK